MTWSEIAPLIATLIVSVPAIVGLWKGLKKERAEATQVIMDAAEKLIKQYTTRVDELEETVAAQDIQIRKQKLQLDRQAAQINRQAAKIQLLEEIKVSFVEGLRLLCEQIRSLGHVPVWEPDEEDTR